MNFFLLVLLFSLTVSSRTSPSVDDGDVIQPYPTEYDPVFGSGGSAMVEPYKLPSHDFCRNNVVNYFSSFPCTDQDFATVRNDSAATLRLLRSCDVFAYVSSVLAARHVNQHLQSIFTYPDSQLPDRYLNLITRRGSRLDEVDVIFRTQQVISQSEREMRIIHGAVGPFDSNLLRPFLAKLATRFQTPLMSYGVEDPQASHKKRFPLLHRTTPSYTLVNLARLKLLRHFNWFKCAVLASPTHPHLQMLQELMTLQRERQSEIELSFYDTFEETAVYLLDDAVEDEMRIFLVISDETGTRNTLCEGHRHSKRRMTGPAYVWIIPLFYDSNWWRLDDAQISQLRPEQRCSNYEMKEILNTTHVMSVGLLHHQIPMLDSGWNQTVEITQTSFLNHVQNLTLSYLPSLSGTNLLPYLLHSKSAAAYDAIWALSRAWHSIIPTLTNEFCSNSNHSKRRKRRSRQEISSMLLTRSLNGTLITDYDPSYFVGLAGHHDFSMDIDTYGKVLVAQYINGTERAVGIYTTLPESRGGLLLELGDILMLSDPRHNLSWPFETPHDFIWLAGRVPSDGVDVLYSEIPTAAIVVVLLTVVLSVSFAVGIGIATVLLRNNKHIKASSPRLSVLVLLGLMLMMPKSLHLGLINSSDHSNKNSTDHLSTICAVGYIVPCCGEIIAFAVLLVKNWRLYRVFYTDSLKPQVSPYLRDKCLVFVALLLMVPYILLVTIRQIVNPLHYQQTTYTVSSTVSKTVTYCTSDNLIAWDFAFISYLAALAFAVLFLSLQNRYIPLHFRHFSMEKDQSSVSVLITLAVFVPALMIMPCFDADPRLYLMKFWTTALVSIALPDILLGTLFLKKFLVIWRERREGVQLARERSMVEQRRSQLVLLGEQASRLKLELKEKEERVKCLQEKSLKERSDSAVSTTSSTGLLPPTSPTNPPTTTNQPLSADHHHHHHHRHPITRFINYSNKLFFTRTPSDQSNCSNS